MTHSIRAYSRSTTQQSQAANTHHGTQDLKPVSALVAKQTAAWESPTIEAFDLCMEVTAYFQQGK